MVDVNNHMQRSQKSQHGSCWWPGTYLVPGHLQLPWWCILADLFVLGVTQCKGCTAGVFTLSMTSVSFQWKLEIVDQWSTRIPRPIGEGGNGQWVDCNWTLFKITRQPFWKLTIIRLLPTATKDMHMKFETEIPKQTWVTLPKPCRPETKKSNMATRQPFRKWGHWKSIGS